MDKKQLKKELTKFTEYLQMKCTNSARSLWIENMTNNYLSQIEEQETEQPNEENIIKMLEGYKNNNSRIMMQSEQNALRLLKAKKYHKSCMNPQCKGYKGTELETICIYCGKKLAELITVIETEQESEEKNEDNLKACKKCGYYIHPIDGSCLNRECTNF